MDPTDGIFPLIAAERRRAADMFDGLNDEQWQARSLCQEWAVRDIAGHLIGPFCESLLKFFLGGLLAGSFHRYSVRMSRQMAERPTSELVAILRANIDSQYAPPGTGPAAALTDLAVHTRDVARPLGLNTTASPEAWREVLAFPTSPRARRGFTRRDNPRRPAREEHRPGMVARRWPGGTRAKQGAGAGDLGPRGGAGRPDRRRPGRPPPARGPVARLSRARPPAWR